VRDHRYTATTYGLKVAFFYSKGLSPDSPPKLAGTLAQGRHITRPLRDALDHLDAEIQKLHEEAALAA
jgi:hypothetical protein